MCRFLIQEVKGYTVRVIRLRSCRRMAAQYIGTGPTYYSGCNFAGVSEYHAVIINVN